MPKLPVREKNIISWNNISLIDYIKLTNTPNKFNIIPYLIPLNCQGEYEYGKQYYKNDYIMYYLKFYNLMMLDYDNVEFSVIENKLKSFIDNGYYFSIYKTYNGYHVFILSHILPYNDINNFILMKLLGCDHYYCLFSHKYGYHIRLNKKKDRDEEYVAKYYKSLGNTKNILPELYNLLKIHDVYLDGQAKLV